MDSSGRNSGGGLARTRGDLRDRVLLDEIDRLTDANRRARDTTIERRLVALRNAALPEVNGPPGRDVWPPVARDPFPDALLAEMPASELTVENIAGGVLHHGAVLARGLLDDRDVARLVSCIDHALEGIAPGQARTRSPDEWFTPFGLRPPMMAMGDQWARMIDSPRSMFEFIEIMHDVGRGLITDYLGERPVMDSHKWTLRRIPPDGGGQWHQDGNFLGGGIRVLNVWLALTRCGGPTPAAGLEFVPRRLDILESGTEGALFDWSIGPPVVERAARGTTLDPVYEAGDALIFDERTAHCTGQRPWLSQDRHAIEAWFFAPSTYDDPERTFVF